MKKILTIIVALLATTGLLAHAGMPPESQYQGLAPISVDHTTLDGGHVVSKAVACGLTFWAFGGFCWGGGYEGVARDWDTTQASNDGVHANTTVVVKTWGEGKVLVILSTSDAYSCAGFQKTYVGYVTAYDTFNLFPYSPTQTDVDPMKSTPAAILTIIESSHTAQLELFNDIKASTKDSDGNSCDWTISHDAALKFYLGTPSSYSTYTSSQSSNSPYDATPTRE